MPIEDCAKQYHRNEWTLAKKSILLNVLESSLPAGRLYRFSDAVCVYWLWRLLTLTFSRGPEGSTNLAVIQVVST